jgi:O-antigen/teichoic acid export membrane protein
MPWIAAGYALLSLAFVFERVCYVYGRPHRVLLIQASTAAVALLAAVVGTWSWGLQGAAVAIPIYFGVQLLIAAALAWRTLMETAPAKDALWSV